VKFEFIVERIIEQLEIPEQEALFKNEFLQHEDKKVSYYNFY